MNGAKSAKASRAPRPRRRRQTGFTLLELLIAATVFLIVAGATFALLGMAQQRYQTDSRILASFQEARLGIDQIVRDVADAGYPPRNQFSVCPQSLPMRPHRSPGARVTPARHARSKLPARLLAISI